MGQKSIFRTGLTDTVINNKGWWEAPGTIRYENNAVYKWVGFSGTTTVAVGDFVCYLAFASDGNAYSVDGANTKLGAGVAMAAIASGSLTTGAVAYAQGWIQIQGLAILSTTIAGSSPVLGNPLTSYGQAAPALGLCSTTAATLALQNVVAVVYDPTAKAVLLKCPN